MKKILVAFIISFLAIPTFAQTILLQDTEPDRVFKETNWGPNRQHFGYWFIDYGMAIPTESKSDIQVASSGQWNFGYAYKMKVFKLMDFGLEISYNNVFMNLNENTRESFDTTRNWDKIRSFQNGLQANAILRFYLNPKRGNYFGPYIDLGFFANYNWGSGWYKEYKDDDLSILQTEYKNGDFSQIAYGPSFSFGRNQLAAFAQYNMNSILDKDVNLNPMPKLIFGVKMNLYSQN